MAWVATICILIDVEIEAEAMDAVAEAMRPLLKAYGQEDSALADWMYAEGEQELLKIGNVPKGFQPDNEWPWSTD